MRRSEMPYAFTTPDELRVEIYFTKCAKERLVHYDMQADVVAGSIFMVNREIKSLENGQQFVILDHELNIAVVGQIERIPGDDNEVVIDVIFIFDSAAKFYVRNGMTVFSVHPKP